VTKSATPTPVRRALRADSPLLEAVADGLGAVKNVHRGYFNDAVRNAFVDSLDLDAALKAGHEQENQTPKTSTPPGRLRMRVASNGLRRRFADRAVALVAVAKERLAGRLDVLKRADPTPAIEILLAVRR